MSFGGGVTDPNFDRSIAAFGADMAANLDATKGKEVEASGAERLNPELLREQLGTIMTSGADFTVITECFESLFGPSIEPEMQELRELIRANPEKVQLLKEHGWMAAKDQVDMAAPMGESGASMAEFRRQVVGEVINVCLGCMQAMGYENPGEHSDTGTPGWNSDIDTVYFAPPGMTEEVQTMEKLVFDMIFLNELGELPGLLFDTESYLSHTAAEFNTEEMVNTGEGTADFARMELNAGVYQMINQCGGPDSEAWKEWKEEAIDGAPPAITDEALRAAFQEAAREAEVLYTTVHTGVEDFAIRQLNPEVDIGLLSAADRADLLSEAQAKDPGLRHAKMGYKSRGLIDLAKRMDVCKATIAAQKKQLEEMDLNRGRLSGFKVSAGKQRAKLQREIEKNQILLGSLGCLRTTFFDEAYNCQGAFKKVCSNEEGQIHQRALEGFQGRLLAERRRRTSSDPEGRIRRQRELNSSMVSGGFVRKEDQKKLTTPVQNAASALENLAMYRGHFQHKAHGRDLEGMQKAMIATSKYSERTVVALLDLMEQAEEKNPALREDKQFLELKNDLEAFYSVVKAQEQAKRGGYLNSTATIYLLVQELKPEGASIDECLKIETAVRDIVKTVWHREGLLGKSTMDETILPQDRYLVMFSKLSHSGLIEKSDRIDTVDELPMASGKPNVDNILKARAGFSKKDAPELAKVFDDHEKITLIAQGMTDGYQIDKFNHRIASLTERTLDLAYSTGTVARPTCGANAPSLAAHWTA